MAGDAEYRLDTRPGSIRSLLEHVQHVCDTPPFLESKSSRKKKSKVNSGRAPPETVWSFSVTSDKAPCSRERAREGPSRTSSRPQMTEEE
jgi:hypothetical protein